MAYRVQINNAADRNIRKLPRSIQGRIFSSLDTLKADPRPHGAIKMKMYQDTYRIRMGDYRILYEVYDDRLLVIVVKVGDRRDVYR